MKASLKFNLPEEQSEYLFAIHGKTYWNALYDIKQNIRSILKYGTEKSLDATLEDLKDLIPHQVDEIE